MDNDHLVTAHHLRRLATIQHDSLLAGCGTLVDTEDGITLVPFRVVSEVLDGNSRLRSCRLLYDRSTFIEDGVIAGARPRTTDGSDLDTRLADIADGINGDA